MEYNFFLFGELLAGLSELTEWFMYTFLSQKMISEI